MSVWELKLKHPEKYNGIKRFYMVTDIDPTTDKNAKENLKREFDNSSDFRDFKNKLYSERTNRWHYSWVVFNDSLSISQKIFGGGFDYLEMFGKKFGIARYDKPHNPFLSTFLYSV